MGGTLVVLGQACHAQFDATGSCGRISVILFVAATRATLVAGLVTGYGLIGGAAGFAASLFLEPMAYLAMKSRSLPFATYALLKVVILPIIATCGMALVVSSTNLITPSSATDIGGLIGNLTLIALAGAAWRTLVLIFVLWWLSGRPDGAESHFLALVRKPVRLQGCGSRGPDKHNAAMQRQPQDQ